MKVVNHNHPELACSWGMKLSKFELSYDEAADHSSKYSLCIELAISAAVLCSSEILKIHVDCFNLM